MVGGEDWRKMFEDKENMEVTKLPALGKRWDGG